MDDISAGFNTFHNFQAQLNSVFSELGGQFKITGNGNVYIGGSNNQYFSNNITLFRQADAYITPVGSLDGHPDCRSIFIIDDATVNGEVILKGDDGGVSLSTNGGGASSLNFTSLEGTGLPITQFYGMGVDAPQKLLIGGTQDNGNFEYDFGTGSWTRQSVGDGGVSRSFSLFDGSLKAKVYQGNPTATLVVTGATNCTVSHTYGNFVLGNPAELYFDKTSQEFRMYVAHGKLFMRSCSATIDKMASLPNGYQNYVWGIGIHEEDDNLMFIGGDGITYQPGSDPANGLLRTRDGGLSWDDISARLRYTVSDGSGPQPFAWFSLTDVIVDPDVPSDEPATVYVSFAGWNSDGTQRVYRSVDDGENWEDISEGLSGLPVNDLEIQRGSGGILYAGTDAGVFVYDPAIGEWQCFNEDMPMCIVTEVKVNLCTKKLFASTFGRGIWQTDIYETPIAEHVISTTTTIPVNGYSYGYSNWRVQTGATLTINGTLSMYPGTGIIVEEGAKLLVDGGTITSACGDFWSGINIYGDNAHNQMPYTHPIYQGMLVLKNGATIENAREINVRGPNWNSFGGVIQATNSNFVNCRRSAQFMAYQNTNAGGYPIANRSFFTNCHFYVDDNYPGGDDFHTHVSMWKVDGIRFSACTFENLQTTITESSKLGHGIVSMDASYSVKGVCATAPPWPGGTCPNYTPTTFKGLDHGIDARNFGTTRSFIVDHCLFEDNVCGIYANGVVGFQVKNSQFKVGGNDVLTLSGEVDEEFDDRHRAVFSTESWGFAIDDNVLTQQGSNSLTEGIVVGYTREHNDVVFRNDATGLESAFVGEGISADIANGYATTRGLWFLCNDNTNNHNNIWARKVTTDQVNPLSDHTIRLNQGLPGRPADNTFDQWTSGSADFDFRVTTTNSPMLYWHRSGGTYIPTNYTIGVTGITPVTVTSTPTNNCASKILPPIPWPPPVDQMPTGAVKDYLLAEKLAYGNTRYLYEQLIDDGNTDEVVQEIESSWPQDAWQLRSYLLSKSPYLSVTTLSEMVKKAILPAAMVTEVLVANPEATKQDKFLNWLQNISGHPLPEYMIDMVVASWDQRTYRTTLEAELTKHESQMTQAGNTLIHHYSALPYVGNDSIVLPVDSILWVWQQLRTPAARYAEAMLLLAEHDFVAATAVITNLPTERDLKAPEVLERQRMLDLIGFVQIMHTNGKDELQLSQAELQSLKSLMGTAYDRPATWISNLLCFAYNDCRPPMTGGTEDGIAKSMRSATNGANAIPHGPELLIHPNPANAWVAFDYDLQVEPIHAFLIIRDLTGKEVYRLGLNAQKQQVVWDTRSIAAGSYTVHLLNKERDLKTEKLIIQE